MKVSQWTRPEFATYVLLYCSRVDVSNTLLQRDHLKSRIQPAVYNSISKQIDGDADIEALDKIQTYVDQHNLSEADLQPTFLKIANLFTSDDNLHVMEIAVRSMLKKLMKA